MFNKNHQDKIQILNTNSQHSSYNNSSYNNRPHNNTHSTNSYQHACLDCGNRHNSSYRCPAEKIQCHACNNVGHFARFCQAKQHQPRRNSASEQHVFQPHIHRPRFQSSSDYNSSRPGYLNTSNHRTQTSIPPKIQQLNEQQYQFEFTQENSNIPQDGIEFENESAAELNEYTAQCYMANDTVNQITSNLKTNWTNIELNDEYCRCLTCSTKV